MRTLVFELWLRLKDKGSRDRLITVRYLHYALYTLLAVTCMLLTDALAWRIAQNRLGASADLVIADARQHGWTISDSGRRKSGWPFGAQLTFDAPHVRPPSRDITAAWAGSALVLGGSWLDWTHQGLAFTLKGRQAFRSVTPDLTLTLTTDTLHGFFLNSGKIHFSGASAHLTAQKNLHIFTEMDLTGFTAQSWVKPSAGPTETRTGLRLSAKHLSGSGLLAGWSGTVDDLDIAVSLAGTQNRHSSLVSMSGYSALLLQHCRASIHRQDRNPTIDLSARLSMPNLDGTATLRIFQWHDAAHLLLESPILQSQLPPKFQEELAAFVQDGDSSASYPRGRPIMLPIDVHQGTPTFGNTKILSIITRMFDASHRQG
ncbi:DUF2125 domain-containing protein [Gluconobacter wancherniae]|uniref:DUF2125 domain-containing protein n=1 Tax=Gluconobacter wancherniae NBRC 103581 TaxID=656744 RepID=A0A511B1M7_9PROT|nr:DUF2125 domain-containing protein [Gluconobacter wancherniae]MBF0853861.1 DUF2125 domain-containing protein [Gluconobacter wancherniae]GBD56916.1 hypothetical protein NBRC103581_01498 [Gluconobacter wancherniae NBRC 103581]GBR64819.1 hypothetical protein AA103581_1509 [Gluconobacter wancherniae NBRC 103581]GEK94318.1 hypothetical protein GWA01_20880 [Gluconobacter wancherniae NBRC 103581]